MAAGYVLWAQWINITMSLLALKGHRPDAYCSNGFQPVVTSATDMSAVGTEHIYNRSWKIILKGHRPEGYCSNGFQPVVTICIIDMSAVGTAHIYIRS